MIHGNKETACIVSLLPWIIVILSIQAYTSSFFVHMDHSNLVHSDIYKQFLGNKETACICLNGQDYYDPCEQRNCLYMSEWTRLL
jgi:hypothetical protein